MGKENSVSDCQFVSAGKVGVVYILDRARIKGRRSEFYKVTGVKRGKNLLDSEEVLNGLKTFIGFAGLINTMSPGVYGSAFDFLYVEYDCLQAVEQKCVMLNLQEIPVFAALRFNNDDLREILSIEECRVLLVEYEEELMCGIAKRFSLRQKLYGNHPPFINENEEGDTYYYAHASAHNDSDALRRKAKELCARLVIPTIGRRYVL